MRPVRLLLVLSLAVLLGVGAGCRDEDAPSLSVYAGAGLRPAMEELADAFQERTGIRVDFHYAGSGMLLAKARLDREADVFIPGDAWYVEQLGDKVAARKRIAWLAPVLLVRETNPKGIRSLKDVRRPEVRVALGRPDEKGPQIGRISRTIFERHGLDIDALRGDDVMHATTVNELGLWVQAGRADVAIVWDAVAGNFEGTRVVRIPPRRNVLSEVVAARTAYAANPGAAKRFIDFAASETGRKILRKAGYRTQPPEGYSP